MDVLKRIAKRNVERLLNEGYSKFDLLNKFTNSYDKVSKTDGTDHLLFEYMLNEIGYVRGSAGAGWILN